MELEFSAAIHSILVFNLYLPCFDGADCISQVNYYAGFLTEICEAVYYADIILLGDFNLITCSMTAYFGITCGLVVITGSAVTVAFPEG